MLLTVNQLEEISPYTHFKRLELILPNLNTTLEKYDIRSNLRISHFLTQLVIESSHFRYIQEPGTGKLYENSTELGNNKLGDGRRFISRGYIKILGRGEYEEYKKFSNIDVVGYPHFVTTPKVAMDISGWIWNKKLLNTLADQDSLKEVTRVLTGDYINLRERTDTLLRTKRALGLI
jgi:predicted chitinase